MSQEPPQEGFWQVVGMIGVAIGISVVTAYALDYHAHSCEGCGKRWTHLGAFNKGDHGAHTCPGCGKLHQWSRINSDGAFKAEGNRLK